MRHHDYTGPWPWPHFTPREIACRCCGELWPGNGPMPEYLRESMDALEELREALGRPLAINSGHRCPEHNAAVGGAGGSQHLRAAFDCRCPAGEQAAFVKAAADCGFTGVGRYPGRGFVHLDLGPAREWRG